MCRREQGVACRDPGAGERRGPAKGSGRITQRLSGDSKNSVLHPQSPEKTFLVGNGRLDKIFFGTDHWACDADTGIEGGCRWTVRRLLLCPRERQQWLH